MNVEKEKVTSFGAKMGSICAVIIASTLTMCILSLIVGLTVRTLMGMF